MSKHSRTSKFKESVNPNPVDANLAKAGLAQRAIITRNTKADLYNFSLIWMLDGRNILRSEIGLKELTEPVIEETNAN